MSQLADFQLPQHLAARRSARRRDSTVQIVGVAIAFVCLIGAGGLLGRINELRKEHQLVVDPSTIKGLPPDIALLGKLGTFRALVIDWAAIRAQRLQDEGKFYEALQLHETVCALAPRFPGVWSNASWNMAYNISVSKYSPEERWRWVNNGITILRDKGIVYNPRAVMLYKDLSWIYWHKIADFLDDEHLNYKRALAVDMERVLGPPPITLNDEEYFAWFKKIADAPHDLKLLLGGTSDAAAVAADLTALGLTPDQVLLDFVAERVRPELQVADIVEHAAHPEETDMRRLALLTDPLRQEAVEALLAAVRSDVLRHRLHLDPEFMYEMMAERYGPLDWRNAYSHALYWSSLGNKMSRGHQNVSVNDQLNNARFVLIVLRQIILKGRVILWPNFDDAFMSYIELTPDTRFIPALFDAYIAVGADLFSDHPDYKEGTPGPVFMSGFVTAMHTWIHLLLLEGGESNRALAEKYFVWLRENHPHPDGRVQERYQQTLDEFVTSEIHASLQTYREAGPFIRGFIRQSLKQYALGLTTAANASIARAQKAYEIWQLDTNVDINERRKLQDIPIMVRDEIEAYMTHPRFAPLYKARLWKNIPLRFQQMCYDRLRPYFERLCDAQDPKWKVELAFEGPPGMEAFRKTTPDYRGALKRDEKDQGRRYKQ